MFDKLGDLLSPMSLSAITQAFILSKEAQGLSPKTLQTYHERLHQLVVFLGDPPFRQFGPELLDDYLVHLQRRRAKYVNNGYRPTEYAPLSPATIETIKTTLRTFGNWLVERGYRDRSPAVHLKRRRHSRYSASRSMHPDDLLRMLAYLKLAARARNPIDIRDLALLAFVADSFVRAGEAAGLDVDDVYWDKSFVDRDDRVTYEARVEGKVGERLVTFSEQTALYMLDWLDVRPELDCPALWVGLCRWHAHERHPRCTACQNFGSRLTPNAIAQMFKRTGKRAGVTGRVNPHALRHLGGIVYAEQAGIEVAQEKLGHTSIAVTRLHYVPQNRERVRRETGRLSFVDRPENDG
jgi:integrase